MTDSFTLVPPRLMISFTHQSTDSLAAARLKCLAALTMQISEEKKWSHHQNFTFFHFNVKRCCCSNKSVCVCNIRRASMIESSKYLPCNLSDIMVQAGAASLEECRVDIGMPLALFNPTTTSTTTTTSLSYTGLEEY